MDNNVDAREFSLWYNMEGQRIAPESYEDFKRLIILAGVFFMIAILFIFMKLEVTIDEIFKWSPVVWLVGVLLCCLLMNFLCYCRRIYKKRQLVRIRRQEELLLSLNLATSFPCLAPPPHDPQCCDGSGYLWPSMRRGSVASLPSYNQVIACSHSMVHDGAKATKVLTSDASSADNSIEVAPPNYDEALKMLSH